MKTRTAAVIRVLVAGVLGVATLEAIAHVGSSRVRDLLSLPGGAAGALGSMIGLYDIPSGPWAIACMIGSFVFYASAWWVLLWFAVRLHQDA